MNNKKLPKAVDYSLITKIIINSLERPDNIVQFDFINWNIECCLPTYYPDCFFVSIPLDSFIDASLKINAIVALGLPIPSNKINLI